MGQKEKEVKAMAVGMLTQRFMWDVLDEIEKVKDPKTIAYLKDNFKLIVLNRLNITMDFLDKRRLSAEEFDNLGKATDLAQYGYTAYLKAKDMKKQEREQNKAQGEQVTPI